MHVMRRWQAWLGVFMLLPLSALCAGLLYGLYRHIVTGELATVAKGYHATSRTIVFSDSPATFVLFFVFHALFAACIIGVTVIVARLSIRRLRARE